MARIEYYFRETASGIRRNGTIAFGAVMTAFIALVPVRTRAPDPPRDRLVIESITGNVQVQVYVDENASQETINTIGNDAHQLPAVDTAVYENKQEACDARQGDLRGQPDDHREHDLCYLADVVPGDPRRHEPVRADPRGARM